VFEIATERRKTKQSKNTKNKTKTAKKKNCTQNLKLGQMN